MADRKYVGLPDLDVAPDLYETPDLIDDISTLPTLETPDEEHPDESGIIRRGISQDQARLRFLPQNAVYENRDVINAVLDDHKPTSESRERRLARLKRELLELQDELESTSPETDELAQLLDSLAVPRATQDLSSRIEQTPVKSTLVPTQDRPPDSSALAHFENKLNRLESLVAADGGIPIMPSIRVMERQLDILTSVSESSLEKVRSQVKTLTAEVEVLDQKRRAVLDAPVEQDSEQIAKINALYGTLGTIETLAPTLPATLDRLRSLRALHSSAATASQTLAELEVSQGSMTEEIRSWRQSLEKVEMAMQAGEVITRDNTKLIEGWVLELEKRLDNRQSPA